MLDTLAASAWADHLREVLEAGRRALVFVLLTVSGIWRSLALALDNLARGLEAGWTRAADQPAVEAWMPYRVALAAAGRLHGVVASAAAALSRLSAAHLRTAAAVDERLLGYLGGEAAAPA